MEAAAGCGRAPLDVARAFLAGGARFIQLRAKTMAGGAFLELAAALVDLARRDAAVVIVNDRPDIARLSGATGVHVGQDDLSPGDVRAVTGADAIVGLSTHTTAQIEWAVSEPIDYVAVGPVFGTATKATGYQAVGLDLVRAAAIRARAAGKPLVAIGGITLETAPSVVQAGAASIAVISDLLSEPERRVRQYLQALA
ncbi:MAG TPA: thiamine phosphate synthase [Vicinamibacterales bacterium]|nr:thiamine phosphate synthase [Vicinamibacterales bacterium]